MKKQILFIISIIAFSLSNVAAQTPTTSRIKTVSAGVVNSKAVTLAKPSYPQAAQAVKASGEVKVQVVIDESGNVTSAEAISGHPLLRQASEKAALQSKFTPTYLSGQAVKVTGVIIYNFTPSPQELILEEEQNVVWVLGMMLSFLQSADSNLIAEIGDEAELKKILADAARDIPAEIVAEKPLFDKLAKSEGEERRIVAAELNRSIKKYFTRAELWQYEVGENLGVITVEMVKHIKNVPVDNRKPDETLLRANLQRIKDLLLSAPPEISPALVKKLKVIAAFADSKTLTTLETLRQLYEAIDPLFASFSDEK